MLARNFRAAAELGINDAQHSALVKVLGLLERGDLTHDPDRKGITDGFNMNYWGDCGTVHCIGGWATKFGADFGGGNSEELHSLFYPRLNKHQMFPWGAYSRITTEQAAHALNNFLTTGQARWAEVLSL